MHLIATLLTAKELAPTLLYPLSCTKGEPLAFRTTTGTVLTRSMRIDFNGHRPLCKRFLFGQPIDLSSQLVRLFAVESPGLASSSCLDLAQPFKDQDTAGIPGTHSCNGMCGLVSRISVHLTNVLPKVKIASLPFDWFAREPLFFTNVFEVSIAMLIESMILDKDCFNDLAILSDGDDRQILHIKVNCYCHQIRIAFALDDFLCFDFFGVREVQFGSFPAENELGTLLFPLLIRSTSLKVAAVLDRVIHPDPSPSGIHLQADKALL